ncbi:hypothetical protein LZD57_22785 [Jiella sp. CBK1P-4]|uniref:Uncharacterized protein n=2 Tax=Jiella avicenniae TaxID=2907202 RepID=A0A9X1T721_9HYPH|nr:hypothetical protein [Jiella avicenniae]
MSDETRDRHRRDLIGAIETIESEYLGANDDPSEDEPESDDLPEATAAGDRGVSESRTADRRSRARSGSVQRAEPAEAMALDRDERIAAAEPEDDETDAPEAGRRGGGRLIGPLIVLLLLFLLGVAIWIALPFFSSGGPGETAAANGGDETLTVADAIRENSSVTAETAPATEWIDLYSSQDLDEFATSDEAIEPVASEGGRTVVKLVQPSGGNAQDGAEGAAAVREIEMPISGDAARRFAGQKAQAEIIVGSPDGEPREFTLRCLFGGETVCGRQRFTTALPEENFLFNLQFPPEAVAGGQIAVDPSVGNGGNDLLFYGLRLRPSS